MADWRRWLRLAEPGMLQQQLLLVIDNMRSSFWAGLLLVGLVRVPLAGTADTAALNLWCVVQTFVVINIHLIIRRVNRAAPLTDAMAQRIVAWMFFNTALGGLSWGAVPWLLPPGADVAQLALVYALLAVVQCGAVSTVSPLMPVLLASMLSSTLMVALHAGLATFVEHTAVAAGALLYVATLMDQSFKGARAARASIELRHENIELLDKLRAESEALERARLAAEHASAAKSKVLAAASHDLRQPLHAQGLFLDVLGKTELTARQRELLGSATDAVSASAGMLGTLFDFSRIEAGVIEPQRRSFALQPLLNQMEREFAPQADAKGLAYRSRESRLAVHSDPALLELILRNLLSNAIRYTPRGGLLLGCRRRGGQALLEVWDTGIGIAQPNQREVFREFHQLDNPERDRRKGFGLGLAIVEGLARTLGHELSLRSRPGHGSVFRLALPLSTVPPLPGPPPGSPDTLQVLSARILVIDDDESIQSGMLQLLTSWGCACDVAGSIEQAVELAGRALPDLVISDYRLREPRSGLQAIAELRALFGHALPALLVTGDTAPLHLREAAEQGITLLHKPVSPGQLYRALVGALTPADAGLLIDMPHNDRQKH